MPSYIREKICLNKPYSIKSKVQYANLQFFLNYLNDEINDLSDMISNDYFDYFLLASEFNIGIIEDKDDYCKNSIIQNINSTSSYGRLICEEYISRNLDYYLIFNENELRRIPITSLYNIFFNPNRRLNDRNQEIAYQFIKNTVENGNESKSFCILFNSLDGSKISSSSLHESFEKRNERFNCIPNLTDSFLDEIDKKISDITNYNDRSFVELKNNFIDIVNNLNQNNANTVNKLKSKMDEIQSELNAIKDSVHHISEEVSTIQTNIGNEISNLNQNIERIPTKFDEKNPFQVMSKDITTLISKTGEIESKINSFDNPIQNIANNLTNISSNVEKIPTKFDEKNPFQVMSKDITTLISKTGEIESKINSFDNPIKDIGNIKINLEKIPIKFNDQNPLQVISNNTTSIITEISKVKASISNFQNPIDEIVRQNNKIKSSIERIEDDEQDIKSDVNLLSNTINIIKNDVISNVKTEMQRDKMFVYYLLQIKNSKPIKFICGDPTYIYIGLFSFMNFLYGNPFIYSDWEISGNSEFGYEDSLKHLCKEENSKTWRSKDEKDSYIQIYTGTRYSFKFNALFYWHESSTENKIDHFTLEKSNDGINWIKKELKNITSDRDSYGKSDSNGSDGFYKWLRFKNSCLNSSNNYRICLNRIELYGTLKED